MSNFFTKSENFKEEYCATIVKVGELKDIENSDNLKQAVIDGFSVVVNKNDVKEGDYMIYCKNETELSAQFQISLKSGTRSSPRSELAAGECIHARL